MVLKLIKGIGGEIFLATILFIMAFTYFNKEEKVINADGKGYYDYLPGLFLYDVSFDYYDSIPSPENQGLTFELDSGTVVSKYFIGTSILMSPFFFGAHLYAKSTDAYKANGYSEPYQISIFYAAFFYLILGLFFLKKLLLLYDLNRFKIFVIQAILLFGTPLLHYTYYEASFSHVYSFFAISLFLYLIKKYIQTKSPKTLYLSGIILGLIFLLRPTNIIIFFFVPFLIGSWKETKVFVIDHLKNRKMDLFLFVIISLAMASIQNLFYLYQTGMFFVYSYDEEGFNFSDPHFFGSLFGFGKGLFIYTPITFFAIVFLGVYTFIKKQYFVFFYGLGFVLLLNYILSSWHCWYYGSSFGLRPWVDFLAIFGLFIGVSFKLKWNFIIVSFLSIFICYLNIIQAYQYRNFILKWDVMDLESYKQILLKTESKYNGYLWRKEIDISNYNKHSEIEFDSKIMLDTGKIHSRKIDNLNWENVTLARFTMNKSTTDDYGYIVLAVDKNKANIYWHQAIFFHGFKENDTFYLDYEFPNSLFNGGGQSIYVEIKSVENPLKLNNLKLELYQLK